MLDVVYLALVIALFAIVGLVVKGVEKLGPAPAGSPRRDAAKGGRPQ